MPRLTASVLALALGTAVLALISCGEEDAQLLPGGTAREITANLDTVQRLADEGDCLGAESAALQVSEQVEALESVDERLKRALRDGAARLNEVVAECDEEAEAAEPVPVPTQTEPDEGELEKDEEKMKEREEKEKEKEEKEQEKEGEEEEGAPPLPPQAEGEGKGVEKEDEPSSGEGGEGSPSGGLGPGSPAGGD